MSRRYSPVAGHRANLDGDAAALAKVRFMAEEKYINKDIFGNIEFSDTPQSILQPKYELRDDPFRPGVKQAYDASSFGITPSFDVETDLLGHHHLSPPGSSIGTYYGGGGGGYTTTRKPEGRVSVVFSSLGWGIVLAVLSLVPAVVANIVFNNDDQRTGDSSFDTDRFGGGAQFEASMICLLIIVGALTLGMVIGRLIQHTRKGRSEFSAWGFGTFGLGIAASIGWMIVGYSVARSDHRGDRGQLMGYTDAELLIDAVPPIAAAVLLILIVSGMVAGRK